MSDNVFLETIFIFFLMISLFVGIAFFLFNWFNVWYITFFGANGLKILDRHFSENPEKEQLDIFSANYRFIIYCFKYALRRVSTKSLIINLWMINNSLITILFVCGTIVYSVLRVFCFIELLV